MSKNERMKVIEQLRKLERDNATPERKIFLDQLYIALTNEQLVKRLYQLTK